MLLYPHPSHQQAGLQHTAWRLQQEVTRPKARFKPTSPKKCGVDTFSYWYSHFFLSLLSKGTNSHTLFLCLNFIWPKLNSTLLKSLFSFYFFQPIFSLSLSLSLTLGTSKSVNAFEYSYIDIHYKPPHYFFSLGFVFTKLGGGCLTAKCNKTRQRVKFIKLFPKILRKINQISLG